jgi:hypothetical protein
VGGVGAASGAARFFRTGAGYKTMLSWSTFTAAVVLTCEGRAGGEK